MNYISKTLTILFTITCLSSCNSSQKKEPAYIDTIVNKKNVSHYGYKNTKWRMTIDEVKKVEKNLLIKNTKSTLVYHDSIEKKQFDLIYYFDKSNKLVKINHIFRAKRNEVLKMHNKLRRKFINQHGIYGITKDKKAHQWSTKKYNIFMGMSSKQDSLQVVYTYLSYDEWKMYLLYSILKK